MTNNMKMNTDGHLMLNRLWNFFGTLLGIVSKISAVGETKNVLFYERGLKRNSRFRFFKISNCWRTLFLMSFCAWVFSGCVVNVNMNFGTWTWTSLQDMAYTKLGEVRSGYRPVTFTRMFEPRHNILSNVRADNRKYVVTWLKHSRESNRRYPNQLFQLGIDSLNFVRHKIKLRLWIDFLY